MIEVTKNACTDNEIGDLWVAYRGIEQEVIGIGFSEEEAIKDLDSQEAGNE